MIINSPIFSGSITQAKSAYADLSGSFTGSFTGQIQVTEASFEYLIVSRELDLGTYTTDKQQITGSIFISGSTNIAGPLSVLGGPISVDGVNVLDTAIAYAIALG
jgi:hypothetical protein